MIQHKPNSDLSRYDDVEDNFTEEERLNFDFRPISATSLEPAADIPWLWHGYLAPKHVTLLTGMWKAGKTTLLTHLMKSMQQGGSLGTEINSGRVLYVTEESETIWARRRDKFSYDDSLKLSIQPFLSQPDMRNWNEFIPRVSEYVVREKIDLVVFDTWSRVNPSIDENDAQKINASLLPLNQLKRAGAAILLVHHPRKAQGGEFTSARGSGALSAFVDVIVELRRFNPNSESDPSRILKAVSRFEETEAEIVVELTDDGYKTVGTMAEATQDERLDAIESILSEAGEPLMVKDVKAAWPDDVGREPSIARLRKDLELGHNTHRWDREGKGVKGDPHCYFPIC